MKKNTSKTSIFQRKAMHSSIAAVIAALIMLAGTTGCRRMNSLEETDTANGEQKQTSVSDISAQQEAARHTAEPTEAPETAHSDDTDKEKEEEQPSFSISRPINGRSEWLRYSQRLLSGENIDEQPCILRAGAVFFGVEEDMLVAYNKAFMIETAEGVVYDLFDPDASFSSGLGETARKSLSDYYRRNLDPAFKDDERLQMVGYYGEDYVIITNEVFQGLQAAAIFRTDDGGRTWMEFSAIEGYPKEITGGCILSDKMGFLCYADRDLRVEGYSPHQLTVYKTEDGGKTWENLELTIPESEVGMIADPTIALSPIFDGEHGIMLVTYSKYIKQRDVFDNYIGWFESFNGGDTWEFHPDPVAEFLKQ